jgi:hypothetical protein
MKTQSQLVFFSLELHYFYDFLISEDILIGHTIQKLEAKRLLKTR